MSTLADFGIPEVGSGGIYHPKQKQKFRITFANLGGGVDSKDLSFQVVKTTKPQLEWAEVPLHRYNSVAYIAGKHSWSPLNITFEDDVASKAATILQAQLQKQQWLIGAEGQWLAQPGEGSLYKFAAYLDSLDGNDEVTERWLLEGSWFQKINFGDLDYSTGDAVTIEATLRFDHARQRLGTYTQGPGMGTGGAGTI